MSEESFFSIVTAIIMLTAEDLFCAARDEREQPYFFV